MAPKQKPGRSKQDYETPPAFIKAVYLTFGFNTTFDWDLAASHENTQAAQFFTPEMDSLQQDWSELAGNLWLNPPFGHIEPWVQQAHQTVTFARRRIFVLLPASVGANWYAKYVEGSALVLALRPRLTFVGQAAPYPKDLILAIYGNWPGFHTWDWSKHNGLA